MGLKGRRERMLRRIRGLTKSNPVFPPSSPQRPDGGVSGRPYLLYQTVSTDYRPPSRCNLVLTRASTHRLTDGWHHRKLYTLQAIIYYLRGGLAEIFLGSGRGRFQYFATRNLWIHRTVKSTKSSRIVVQTVQANKSGAHTP